MTREEWSQAAWRGWALGTAGVTSSEFLDVLEIGRLNCRASAAWERENMSEGHEPTASKAAKANERASTRAALLAAERGWELEMNGGLWWSLSVPGYDGNALCGLR